MAKKKVAAIIRIQIPAGKATPAPPVGTALGPHGVPIMDFVKQYNAATESQVGTIVPVEITVFEDRSFSFVLKTPPTPVLLRQRAGLEKGSTAPGKTTVGTVSEVDIARHLSRITLVTSGTPMIIEQIKAQLARLVPVHRVSDLTIEGPHLERELALVKVRGTGDKRVESLRIADIFRARVVDATIESFVFEMTGSPDKLNAFIGLMQPLGLIDVSRTGVVAIARGPEAL